MTPDEVAAQLRFAGSVFAEEEAALLVEAFDQEDLPDALRARCEGEPLEHILGWAMFAGLRVQVMPGVFVPRRRTELLLHEALDRLPRSGVLVEICCGAAPVATAVAAARVGARVHACDIDPTAALCALENLAPYGGTASAGDMGEGIPDELFGNVDVLVANAPYVPTRELALMPREARLHEPESALDGGLDGLGVQRRVAGLARRVLRPGGVVLVETSRSQVEATSALLGREGLDTTVVLDDETAGTCVIGTLGV